MENQLSQEALHAALGANRSVLLERLRSDGSLQRAARLREETKGEADWYGAETDDVTWSFVQECLLLLLALTRHLTEELKRFQEAPPPSGSLRTPEMAPPLPPDVLSVSQQKTLGAALQFVVSLGVCPYLSAGVGVPLGRRSAFGAVVEKLIRREASPPAGRRLLTTTRVLLQVAEMATLATLVFSRHLGDVMAALCQLGYEPHREDHRVGLPSYMLLTEESRSCKEALKNLLGKVYQPIVAKELLVLQGGPKQVPLRVLTQMLFLLCREQIRPSHADYVLGIQEKKFIKWVTLFTFFFVGQIWVVGNSPSPTLLAALQDVLPVIFTLFCFTKQSISHLRAPCQEILLWFLKHSETSAALPLLRQLSGLRERGNDVAAAFHFTAGGDGGVRLVCRQTCSDEDEELYEKLSGEQWRLECLVQLLAQLSDSDLAGDFFLDLLQELTGWAAAVDEELKDEEEVDVAAMTLLEVEQQLLGGAERRAEKLTLLQALAVMVESLEQEQLLRKTSQVVDFMVSLLQRACVGLDGTSAPGVGNPVESQTLSMGMGLVATLLSISAEDYSCMLKLLRPLETLSQQHPDVVIQELASNLRAVIATHGAHRPENLADAARCRGNPDETTKNSKAKSEERNQQTPVSRLPQRPSPPSRSGDPDPSNKSLSDWLLEACDPDVPTRAVALRVVTRMVQRRHPEAVQAQEKVLTLFLENLEHEDSFVYLSAIQGLAVLAESYPGRILERLLQDFQRGPSLPSSKQERSLETRLKVGEVLMRASRAMGELAPHLGRPLLGVFLQGTRDPDQSVRASSLSNLGELCQRLDYSLGPLAQELSSCLTALIKTDREAEVRRAAVHVIAQLLRGLSDKTTQVLSDVLLDLYRALKLVVRSDPDQAAVLHAQLALEELDDVMRRFVFPEQKLEKKIVVLP
uniref:Transport and golgi organization 6 homolog (Drosophila) n=1 Tax=Xiphophorus couchianus TaxID=32473 RepID=A0A3B5M3R8_9TELE